MHAQHHCHVLQLDIQGMPQAWITLEQAALYVTTGSVAWVDGNGPQFRLRGGNNVARGRQSIIDIHPVMALAGRPKVNLFAVEPTFTRVKLLRRDRMTCAYCGQRHNEQNLSCDHIVPQARGGRWTWMNLVTACGACNGRKADRTTPRSAMGDRSHSRAIPHRLRPVLTCHPSRQSHGPFLAGSMRSPISRGCPRPLRTSQSHNFYQMQGFELRHQRSYFWPRFKVSWVTNCSALG